MHTDRWGIAIFSQSQLTGIHVDNEWQENAIALVPDIEVPISIGGDSEQVGKDLNVFLALNQLGNNVDTSAVFSLDKSTVFRIVSLGEITGSGERYDFGQIKNMDTGAVVWDFLLENTKSAGGHDSNRIFDDEVELSPGRYVVSFKTDETHAFNNFDTSPPLSPESWGITIIRP